MRSWWPLLLIVGLLLILGILQATHHNKSGIGVITEHTATTP